MYMETKINKLDAGYMIKLAAMPIYGIHPLRIFFTGTIGLIFKKLCMKHQRLKLIIYCSNDNPGLTLAYFTAWSNFAI